VEYSFRGKLEGFQIEIANRYRWKGENKFFTATGTENHRRSKNVPEVKTFARSLGASAKDCSRFDREIIKKVPYIKNNIPFSANGPEAPGEAPGL